jgi:hypothetical protein
VTDTKTAAPADDDGPDDSQSQALVPRRPLSQLVNMLPGGLPVPLEAEKVQEYVIRLMDMLPPPKEDVTDRLAAMILMSDSEQQENEIWSSTTSSKELVGKRFIFHSVHIQPSDYPDSWSPYYIICPATDCETGEETAISTGSLNLVTSLVKAQLLGNLPWEAEIAGPRRVPKSGHIPLHIRWVGKIVEPGDGD